MSVNDSDFPVDDSTIPPILVDPEGHRLGKIRQKYLVTPDYEFWGVAGLWTFEEANALLLNIDPGSVNWSIAGRDKQYERDIPIIRKYLQLQDLLFRDFEVAELRGKKPLVLGSYSGIRELFMAAKLEPITLVNWAQRIGMKPPQELSDRIASRAQQPTYSDLLSTATEAKDLRVQINELKAHPLPQDDVIDPRERTSLLKTVGALSLALSRLHNDCSHGDGKPNRSGIIRQIQQSIPENSRGMSDTQLDARVGEAIELVSHN